MLYIIHSRDSAIYWFPDSRSQRIEDELQVAAKLVARVQANMDGHSLA